MYLSIVYELYFLVWILELLLHCYITLEEHYYKIHKNSTE